MVWFVIAAVATVGATLLACGLRGWRVDDHPLCRRFGYDLHAITQPAKCPECGGNLNLRRAIILGNAAR